MAQEFKISIDGKDVVVHSEKSRRDRVLDALVNTIERMDKTAATAEGAEAMAAVARAFNEVDYASATAECGRFMNT